MGKSEAEVKLDIGDWLGGLGLRILDERPNPSRPRWGLFTVGEVDRNKRPDLIIQGNLAAKGVLKREAYVAVEIKRGVRGPWDAYPMTFTISRLLWRQRDNLGFRKLTHPPSPSLSLERGCPKGGGEFRAFSQRF